MRIRNLFFVFIAIFLFIVTGCSNRIENVEQRIEVQERVGDENKYEDFKVVTDNIQVQKVKKILKDTDWENAKVDMAHPPDYEFIFQYKNPNIQAKAVVYNLWISPNNDKVEIARGGNQYAQLTKENSAILFEIITGNKLSELK
ncbi:hypothetical protein JFL43_02880 [Viridibacillus sp. YIM B01967]|uniref:YhfM-like domain-containing protein n=1 Tax=Viridibacillus soli TaxID=2798301 RepID=A0ABS1H335_9BACL|nr:hypothetical protein [Viridibacillus soli]MBK3493819.1 hypothetical protein [Viridibacillus soli]